MRILQIHNDYLLPGGETSSVRKVASLLEEYGHEVTKYWHDNQDLAHPTFLRAVRFARDVIYNPATRRDLRAVLCNVDIVHVHNMFPVISPAALYAAREAGKPIVLHLQNYRLFCANGMMVLNGQIHEDCIRGDYRCSIFHGCQRGSNLLGILYAASLSLHRLLKSFEMPDHYIAISGAVKDIFIRFGLPEDRITVLHHFVDAALYDAGKADEGFYMYVGRLSREKGVRTLVEAFAERPELKLKIVGDGPDGHLLRQMANQRKAKNIEFLGYLERQDFLCFLPKARAVVLPSECHETFGLAALEALACGVPVIGARVGGIIDIVSEGETGQFFSSGNKIDLIECIDRFENLRPSGLNRFRSRARETAVERFNKKTYYDKLMQIYDRARSGN